MHQAIYNQLLQIEREYNVCILYAVESGSQRGVIVDRRTFLVLLGRSLGVSSSSL